MIQDIYLIFNDNSDHEDGFGLNLATRLAFSLAYLTDMNLRVSLMAESLWPLRIWTVTGKPGTTSK